MKPLHHRPLAELDRKRRIGFALGGGGGLLLAWHFSIASGLIKPLFLPPPSRVLEAARDIGPTLILHSVSTLSIVAIGYTTGAALGLIAALTLRQSRVLRGILTPLIDSWRPVPAAALIPFFILWFGYSWTGKCVLVAAATFLIVVVAAVELIDQMNPIYLRMCLSLGGGNWAFLRRAAQPAILPQLIGPLRVSLAIGLSTTVVSEYMGATLGIGQLINVSLNTFATHTLMLCAILLGIAGAVLDVILRIVHRSLTRWAWRTSEALDPASNLPRKSSPPSPTRSSS